jgi:hypothetical protein
VVMLSQRMNGITLFWLEFDERIFSWKDPDSVSSCRCPLVILENEMKYHKRMRICKKAFISKIFPISEYICSSGTCIVQFPFIIETSWNGTAKTRQTRVISV